MNAKRYGRRSAGVIAMEYVRPLPTEEERMERTLHGVPVIEEHAEGDLMMYADYAALQAENATLKAELADLNRLKEIVLEAEPDLGKKDYQGKTKWHEFDGYFVHWDEVVKALKQAWPGKDVGWDQSPMELVTELIEERDEAKAERDRLKERAQREREALDQMKSAARNAGACMDNGWISPEGQGAEFERGWYAACLQFKCSGARHDLIDALAAVHATLKAHEEDCACLPEDRSVTETVMALRERVGKLEAFLRKVAEHKDWIPPSPPMTLTGRWNFPFKDNVEKLLAKSPEGQVQK